MNDCCKSPCPPICPCIPCPKINKNYAYYSQTGRLYNTARFGGLNFNDPPVQTSAFAYDSGIFQIIKPGIYLVSYGVYFPNNAEVDTTLVLQTYNTSIPGSVHTVQKTLTNEPLYVFAQAVLNIEQYDTMRLSSSSIVDFALPEQDTAATLSIIEL